MPSHIKQYETALSVVAQAVSKRFDPENNTLGAKVKKAVKRVKQAVEEARG